MHSSSASVDFLYLMPMLASQNRVCTIIHCKPFQVEVLTMLSALSNMNITSAAN